MRVWSSGHTLIFLSYTFSNTHVLAHVYSHVHARSYEHVHTESYERAMGNMPEPLRPPPRALTRVPTRRLSGGRTYRLDHPLHSDTLQNANARTPTHLSLYTGHTHTGNHVNVRPRSTRAHAHTRKKTHTYYTGPPLWNRGRPHVLSWVSTPLLTTEAHLKEMGENFSPPNTRVTSGRPGSTGPVSAIVVWVVDP